MYYFCFAALSLICYVAGIQSKHFVNFQKCLNASGGYTAGDSVMSVYTYFLRAILSPLFRKSMRIAVLHQPAQQDNPKIRQILGSPEIVQHQHLQQHQIPK